MKSFPWSTLAFTRTSTSDPAGATSSEVGASIWTTTLPLGGGSGPPMPAAPSASARRQRWVRVAPPSVHANTVSAHVSATHDGQGRWALHCALTSGGQKS